MCGIAGILNFKNINADESVIREMTNCMAHRGPDADGFFVEGIIALGHRRLAIIDLSPSANQPFSDNSGRYKMVFNGEIYNYKDVKALITDYDFKTTSDTEVIIAAYSKWGPDCLSYLRGMFTIAIWDRVEEEIFIARDRMGIKPLHFYIDEDKLLFASELRAIIKAGDIPRKINEEALVDYFSYQSVAYPFSIIQNIQQLEAGCWMKIKKGSVQKRTYWDVAERKETYDFSSKEKVHSQIRELMLQSVKRRLVSDVPVGAFLSGGIDSSIVVGLMAEAGEGRPNTFNIAFSEKEYDESYYADMIAKKFNTCHTSILLKPETFLEELQNALDAMDTPSGDGINTYVVSKAIRQQGMAVALSGIGGDELFAGYPYFTQYLQLQRKKWLWNLPKTVRRFFASGEGSKKDRIQQLLLSESCSIENVYPIFRQILTPELLDKLTRLGDIKSRGGGSLRSELEHRKNKLKDFPLLSQVSIAEYLGYTQHTLLKDTDQMSMANSLEVREPFFDKDLIEFVLAVPDHLKNPTYPKSLLVESVKPMLPDEIVFRKKQGFLFPWNLWLKNELRSFCEQRINNISSRSFINGNNLRQYWKDFLNGNTNIRWTELWLFVVLEYWFEKNNID